MKRRLLSFNRASASAPLLMSAMIANLKKMLDAGRDSALLRFSLGNEYLKTGNARAAVEHLRAALAQDAAYSAAWKLLGRALEAAGADSEALAAYQEGIRVAEARGDKQAAKEMSVFARRIERKTPSR